MLSQIQIIEILARMRPAEPISEFYLFGIRNARTDAPDGFDDLIGYIDAKEGKVFSGTCDAGVYWNRPENREREKWPAGAPHLDSGYHKNIWAVGNHNGETALVNRQALGCAPARYWRDVDCDFYKGMDKTLRDFAAGIDCHSAHDASSIGRWGGGCQVVRKHFDFAALLAAAINSRRLLFSYWLFEADREPELYRSLSETLKNA